MSRKKREPIRVNVSKFPKAKKVNKKLTTQGTVDSNYRENDYRCVDVTFL